MGMFSTASQDRYENRPDSQTYAVGMNMNYRLAETLSVDTKAGASFARQGTDNNAQSVGNWRPYGSVSITNKSAKWKTGLSMFLGYSGGGSLGTPSYRADTNLFVTYQITESWSWDTRGYYQWNQPAGGQGSRYIATAGGSTGIKYRLAEWASLGLSGDATKQHSNTIAGADITRYTGTFGLNLAYPIKIL